jgi:geranylgeranyl diphosphate synthase type I
LLTDVGAVDEVEDRITGLTANALRALRAAPIPDSIADRLADLAINATSRVR